MILSYIWGMKISDKTIQALKIIRDSEEISASDFALKMWPNSPKWKKVYNTGDGATSGKGMWLAAGSYLSKLRKAGLLWSGFSNIYWYRLSSDGRKVLKEYES